MALEQAWDLLKSYLPYGFFGQDGSYQMHEGDEKHFDYDYSAPITPQNWDSKTFDDWHSHWYARDSGAYSRHDFNQDEYGRNLLRNPDGSIIGPEISMDDHIAYRKLRRQISKEAFRRINDFIASQKEKGLDPHRPEGQAYLEALLASYSYDDPSKWAKTVEDIPTWEGE